MKAWVPKFGESVRNSSASERNPRRDCYFVRKVVRRGLVNPGVHYECTDGKGEFWLLPMVVVISRSELPPIIAESTAGQRAPLAWMRAWAYRGETPHKERKENGRMAWPLRFKVLAITQGKILPDDVPLYTANSIN